MRISIQPICLIYFACVSCFSSWQSAFFAIVALLIHELGHFAAAAATGEEISCLKLSPCGGMIQFRHTSLKGIRGVLVAAGGPLANLCAILLLASKLIQNSMSPDTARLFAAANCVMLIMNCVPALPLDGGRMLFALGYYVFPVKQLVNTLCILGMICGLAMIGLACYGWSLTKEFNLSLIIIGAYMVFQANAERMQVLMENAYAVFQEKKSDNRRVKAIHMYRIAPETRVFELMRFIAWAYESVFVIEDDSEQHILYESDIQRLMLNSPRSAIEKAFKAGKASISGDSDENGADS